MMAGAQGRGAAEELRGLFGPEAVLEGPEALASYGEAEYPCPPGEPACALVVREAGEVIGAVRAARRLGLNLVPVSSSPRHRKGGSCPRGSGTMLDLSGMRGILRLDRRNRVALVEPGVDFPQLREAAAAEGLRVLAPLAPRPGKSVLASCLEREPFLIPKYHWDTTDPLLCMEVVFGTGEVFRTGSAAGPGGLEEQWERGNFQKNPMGPAASDLGKLVQGAQGTLGVAVWGSVKLELRPESRSCWTVRGSELSPLLGLAREACRRRLGDEILLFDEPTFDCLLGGADAGDEPPASDGGPAGFILIYILSGISGYLPRERLALQERRMRELAHAVGAGEPRRLEGEEEARLLRELEGSGGTWWKHRRGGGCQEVLFLATMDRAPRLFGLARQAAAQRGLPEGQPALYLQPILQGRACHLELLYFYNMSEVSERREAWEAAGEAAERLAAEGAFFSRPHPPWEDIAYARCPDTVRALRRLKLIFDPDNVLNGGRLCFAGGGGRD